MPFSDTAFLTASCKLYFIYIGMFTTIRWIFVWLVLIWIFDGGAVPPREMDPEKNLEVYGYGTVAWKDRI